MANTIFSSEGALLFIMVATVALGFWLQRFKVFKTLGPALTVIVMGIVMSNLRIVPTSSPPMMPSAATACRCPFPSAC